MSPDRHPPVPPILAIAFGILAVSTASIFIRFAQREAPSLVIAATRLVLATLVLAPLALARYRQELAALRRIDLVLALLSGIFLALHFATWISSLEFTSVVSSVVLVSTTPLWVALLSPLTLKEPLTRPVITGMGIALLGGLIVALNDSGGGMTGRNPLLGDLLALAGAITVAGYVIIGRRLRARMSLIPYIFVVYGMAASVLVVMVLISSQPLLGYSTPTYLWMLLLALVPQLLGHSTFNWALGYLSAAYVSITLLGEPIGSTILAYFLLRETPTAVKVFGAILILVGIYLASRPASPGKASPDKVQP